MQLFEHMPCVIQLLSCWKGRLWPVLLKPENTPSTSWPVTTSGTHVPIFSSNLN